MSKIRYHHPEPQEGDLVGPRYWRSLDDLADTPAFRSWVEREFPEGAADLDDVNRRHFMKIMAASFGLAGVGLAGCRQPVRHILPYAKQPENMVPGVPVFFSSSAPTPAEHIPLVVETHGARPTKLEGNPSYPVYGGSTNLATQAALLDVYDPDRSTVSTDRAGNPLSPGQVQDRLAAIHAKMAQNRGRGVAFLAESSTSPTRSRLVGLLKKQFPEAIWAEYDAVDTRNPERTATRFLESPMKVTYDFSKARRILSLDGDFLGAEPGQLGFTRGFSQGRKVKNKDDAGAMNRLYVVESDMTLTGAMADHRLRLSTRQIPAFAALLAAEVLEQAKGDKLTLEILREKATGVKVDPRWIKACAEDLFAHKGQALVFAGSHLGPEVHLLAGIVNDALGAFDRQGRPAVANLVYLPEIRGVEMAALASAIRAGGVETLVIVGGNPAYNAPADLDFPALAKQAGQVVRFGFYHDETSALADLHVAASHFLESWGDGRAYDGTVVPVQPVIEPLFETLSEVEFLARVLGEADPNPYNQVRATFATLIKGGDLDQKFAQFLAEGILPGSAYRAQGMPRIQTRALNNTLLDLTFAAPEIGPENLEVRLIPCRKVGDGRQANNGWLQECPEPMSKLTWDNAILVSPRLARKLQDESGYPLIGGEGIMQGAFGEKFSLQVRRGLWKRGREHAPIGILKVGDTEVKGPIHVMPGLATYTVVVSLGYGRTAAGRVGNGAGFNGYPLKTTAGAAAVVGATLKISDEDPSHQLANTQEHWSMEGRAIIREATAVDYAESVDRYAAKHGKPGSFVDEMGMESHSPPVYGKALNKTDQEKAMTQPRGNSLYGHPSFTAPPSYSRTWGDPEKAADFIPPQQWGMTIDLNVCTGCNACVVACQSENNIPIVGKDQVLRGREMHWIRLDRYFSASLEETSYEDAVQGQYGAAAQPAMLPIPEDVQVSFQGIACAHCELAPCENVCPVNATVHDFQGLNVMAYNRCVGTRYCANNCPYKVRRYNFFDWNKRVREDVYLGPFGREQAKQPNGELLAMKNNPDVTVRSRGVMEKCTYCVQRIENAKIQHKVKMAKAGEMRNVNVPDGTIKTACQQVCPAEAIVFGDVSDADSAVSMTKSNDRNYSLLGYLNIRPRTTFLAKLRNPNPAMPGAYTMPFSRQDYERRYGHGGAHGDHGDHGQNGSNGHGPAGEAHGDAAHPADGATHGEAGHGAETPAAPGH